ncbi:MAG: TIGR04197 family type VII secretion effector, partial [Eggerthellaceae bacterium]|nr:TIGR04197 family type VII secretion effector [Eggerthellaceae bacterium]
GRLKITTASLQSDTSFVESLAQTMKVSCEGIGITTIEASGNTNLSGFGTVAEYFSDVNSFHQSLTQLVESDALHMQIIAKSFSELDAHLAAGME